VKIGDPKQVAGLGIVALIAIGYVGSTAFKTIKQNSFSGPVIVEELGSDGTVVTDREANSSIPPQSTTADVFADSFTPSATHDETPNVVTTGPIDTQPPTLPISFPVVPIEPLPGLPEAGEPETKPEKSPAAPVKAPPKTKLIQYVGFVESSTTTAILTVDGSSHTVGVGDSLGDGFVVKSISADTITVRSKTATHSISIGKEKQLS
jgi:hypothetical protein